MLPRLQDFSFIFPGVLVPQCWELASQGCFSSFYMGCENGLVSVLDTAPLVHLKGLWKGSQVVHCYQLHMDSEAFL